jgi:tight adherence protein B
MDRVTVVAVTLLAFVAVVALVFGVGRLATIRFGHRARQLQRQIAITREEGEVRIERRLARGATSEVPVLLRHLLDAPLMRRLDLMLVRAGSSRSPLEIIALMLMLSLGGFLLPAATGLGALLGLALALALPAIPPLWLLRVAHRRRARFQSQFPDALDFICRALRAGHGFMAGLGMVSTELPDPVASEFRTTFEEINFGAPVNEALARLAARVDSPDLEFFVVAVVIQRETGGNLAELLGGLSSTVRERMKLAGKVRALSAEGRLSGILMTALPFALAGILTTVNPVYMSALWSSPMGRHIVGVVLLMMLLGSIWIQFTVRIRV